MNLRQTCDITCDMGTCAAVFVADQYPAKTILKRLKMEAEIAKDLDELEKMLG